MDQLLKYLIKYPPVAFEKGELALKTLSLTWLILLGVSALLFAGYSYYRLRSRLSWAKLAGLALLRGLALVLLLLWLARPVLLVPSVVPQKSFLAILYDTSRSMGLADEAGDSRIAAAVADSAALLPRLAEKFQLRLYRFDRDQSRIDAPLGLEAAGRRTDIQRALERILSDLSSLPLSGIIIYTDGADNRSDFLIDLARQLRFKKVPLYPVGVGSERPRRDLALASVSAPALLLRGSGLTAEVAVRANGLSGRRALLRVQQGDRPVLTREILLGADGEVSLHRIDFVPQGSGLHRYIFSVKAEPEELTSENNQIEALVRVVDEKVRLLYVDGEPRWEYRFIKRALEEDDNLKLAGLIRTGKKQFLRQGLERNDELASGYPRTRADLFKYHGIIFGSVEASSFDFEQLKLTEDFVNERGGSFLMLGGRKSFRQGGYAGTPIEKLFPINLPDWLERPKGDEFRAQPTEHGKFHPATRLLPEEANFKAWSELPPIGARNLAYDLKPGATALLTLEPGAPSGRQALLLSFQRYGRGRSLAFLSDSSWRWRMGLDHNNRYFETFWRQLLRWMVAAVPEQIEAKAKPERVEPHETIEFEADVRDESFNKLSGAEVRAKVRRPLGQIDEVRLDWRPEKEGTYRAEYRPLEEGVYTVELEATARGRRLGSATFDFKAGDTGAEYAQISQNRELLERLARESGGRYYGLKETARLPEEITYTENEASIIDEHELWDMPAFLILFLLLLSSEWFLRKSFGLI